MKRRYTSDGRPSPTGLFELINGRLTLCDGKLEDGERMAFDPVLMDSAPAHGLFLRDANGATAGVQITDAERDYVVASARAKHNLTHPNRPFTADHASAAIARAGAGASIGASLQTDARAEIERLQSEADGARIARKHITANAWRR